MICGYRAFPDVSAVTPIADIAQRHGCVREPIGDISARER
jgi:hypothetical protein